MGKPDTNKYAHAAAVDIEVQQERAYQAQSGVNENSRRLAKKRLNKKGKARYHKSIGLGFKTPKEAISGTYIDKKCPFTGKVSIRGRIIRGVVTSAKQRRTVTIRRNYLHFVQKYQRYMKRHKNFNVHCSPCFDPKVGDEIIAGQCRPLSKTVRYNALQVVCKTGKAGKKFAKH